MTFGPENREKRLFLVFFSFPTSWGGEKAISLADIVLYRNLYINLRQINFSQPRRRPYHVALARAFASRVSLNIKSSAGVHDGLRYNISLQHISCVNALGPFVRSRIVDCWANVARATIASVRGCIAKKLKFFFPIQRDMTPMERQSRRAIHA